MIKLGLNQKLHLDKLMERIYKNLYLGSFAEVQDIKKGKLPVLKACLSVGSEFSLSDVSSTQFEGVLDIILPDLNLIGVNHLQLSIDDGSDNAICKILPEAITFIDNNIHSGVYVHCFAGVSRSASIVYAYMLYKGEDPIKAFEKMTSRHGVVHPYREFISEILDYFQMPSKNIIMKELNSGLYKYPS